MGAWRNNKPTVWSTTGLDISATYTGHWTGLIGAWARDNRPTSTTVYTQKSSGTVPDLTISGATAQDDCWRLDGVNDKISCTRDADMEGATTAATVACAARLLSTSAGSDAMISALCNMNTGGARIGLYVTTNFSNVDLVFRCTNQAGSLNATSGLNCSWDGISSPTSTDVVIVGKWTSGSAPTVELYKASDGSLLDSSTGSTASGTITYGSESGSGFRVGNNDADNAYRTFDWGGAYLWSRALTSQEITDLVTDFYGPLRASAYTPPELPYVYTVFKSAV